MQLCSKPRGARGIEPEIFLRRGQLLSRPPTTGLVWVHVESFLHSAALPVTLLYLHQIGPVQSVLRVGENVPFIRGVSAWCPIC